jgi:hypothetical protein
MFFRMEAKKFAYIRKNTDVNALSSPFSLKLGCYSFTLLQHSEMSNLSFLRRYRSCDLALISRDRKVLEGTDPRTWAPLKAVVLL